MTGTITEHSFGTYSSKPVIEYTITNAHGMQVSVMNVGATITKIVTADRNGEPGNVILGFDTLDEYLQYARYYMGCIVGRYCNRIGNATFSLNGKTYLLSQNEGSNSLHGGFKGFDKVWWNIEKGKDEKSLKLSYLSEDGEEGYPGNLQVEVIYELADDNSLTIVYTATTDQSTPVNLTSHCYFNLSAGKEKTVLNHELAIYADHYTVLNDHAIPTGKLVPVKDTAMDFCSSKKIGRDIETLKNGYDLNWVLNKQQQADAILYDPLSGRCMEVETTEPGLQFFSANFAAQEIVNTNETFLPRYAAACLEAQHFPDSPNQPSFPNTILHPGEEYKQTTRYRFSVR